MDISRHLADYLSDEQHSAAPNPATVLEQGERAQAWLLEQYLGGWLQLIGALPDAGYPRARRSQVILRQLGREAERISPGRPTSEQIFYLEALCRLLRGACQSINRVDDRGMQWGIWARDVVLSIAEGFADSQLLDGVVCESIAPCCMYAALLTSMVVEDSGTADEINGRMFETLPRELLGIIRATPAAPEA